MCEIFQYTTTVNHTYLCINSHKYKYCIYIAGYIKYVICNNNMYDVPI